MTTIIVICVLAFILGCLIGFTRTSFFKGKLGELLVKSSIKKLEGTKFNDYTIIDKNGNSHQIDHILVSKSGVFVFETKNYSGRIYGKDSQQNWTQVLQYGKVKNHFYNPVKQNQTHCRCLKEILPEDTKVVSIVIFIKNNIQYIESNYVINYFKIRKTVRENEQIYTDEQVNEFVDILNKNKNTTLTNKEHVKEIKENLTKIENNICPRCGGNLVLRHGKHGDFYGCENYPKCHFIKK